MSLMIFSPRRYEEALDAYDKWDDDRLARLFRDRPTVGCA